MVEAQLYSVDDVNHVNQSSVDSTQPSDAPQVDEGIHISNRSIDDQTGHALQGNEQSGDRSHTSEIEHWPSLLASPDVFLSEFSQQAVPHDEGIQLSDYERTTTDASLLGNRLSLQNGTSDASSPWRSLSQPLTAQAAEASTPLSELDALSFQLAPTYVAPQAFQTAPTDFTAASDSLDSVQDIVSFIQQASPPSHSRYSVLSDSSGRSTEEEAVTDDETVILNPRTVQAISDLDEDQAHQTNQLSDDSKQIDPQLLQPLEETLDELYRFAQQVEQEQLEQLEHGDGLTPLEVTPSTDLQPNEPVQLPNNGLPIDSDSVDIDVNDPDAPLDSVPVLDGSQLEEPFTEETIPDALLEGTPLEDNQREELQILPSSPPSDPEVAEPEAAEPAPDAPLTNGEQGDVIELTSDRQIYDTQRRVFIAEGNVEMLVRGGILNADRVQVNLPNRIAVAEGDIFFTRGEQVLRGDRIEYNLVSEQGTVIEARGEIFLPGVSSDLQTTRTRTEADARSDAPPLSTELARDQPPLETASSAGGVTLGASVGSQGGLGGGAGGGEVRQLRFEANTIDFFPGGWEATNVRITNDPFSPPELELRTSRATFRRLSPTRSELITQRPRLVFDQGLAVPLFRRRFIFDENRRNAALVQFGFDEDDRGGLFIEREFEILTNPIARFSIRPQFFAQRAFDREDDDDGGDFSFADAFGLIANLDVTIDQRTSIDSRLELTSFDLSDFEDEGRGSVRVNRTVLPIRPPFSNQSRFHTLTAEYSFRDRLFNGTLGFQTVQETYGLVLTSPTIRLTRDDQFGQGLDLTYQAAIQRIDANVAGDRRLDLLGDPPFDDVRTTLTRYQAAAQLRRNFIVWRGVPLPATPEEGLRYTPNPVVPFIALIPRVQGIASFYSSGDSQPILTGEIRLQGQFGHFSRPYLDYLGFSFSYRRSTEGSESPFTFDRLNDREVITGSLTAQLFGPFRAGIRTSISLDEDEEFDNSFFLEYSRRTYGIILSYNPDREIGSLGFRLSDFTYTGIPEPFDGAEPDPASSDDDPADSAPDSNETTDSDDTLPTETESQSPESSTTDSLPAEPESQPPESGTIDIVPVDEPESERFAPNPDSAPFDSDPLDFEQPEEGSESDDLDPTSNSPSSRSVDTPDGFELAPLETNPFPNLESLEIELRNEQQAEFASANSTRPSRQSKRRPSPSPIPDWANALADEAGIEFDSEEWNLTSQAFESNNGRSPESAFVDESLSARFTVRQPVTAYQHAPIPVWPGL